MGGMRLVWLSVRDWPAFPTRGCASVPQELQTGHSLQRRQRGFSFSNQKLGVSFDAIYTAEDIGSYKPALGNFEYMVDRLKSIGVQQNEILHR